MNIEKQLASCARLNGGGRGIGDPRNLYDPVTVFVQGVTFIPCQNPAQGDETVLSSC